MVVSRDSTGPRRCQPQRKLCRHDGAVAGTRADRESAPCKADPFLHAEQTETASGDAIAQRNADIESLAIIAHRDTQALVLSHDLYPDMTRAGMPDDVIEGLLHEAKTGGLQDGVEPSIQVIGM